MICLCSVDFKRKTLGPKNKGTVLFLRIMQHNVMPTRVDNLYVSTKHNETTEKFVPVQNMNSLLAEVPPRSGHPDMVTLIPIARAFPVSWVWD